MIFHLLKPGQVCPYKLPSKFVFEIWSAFYRRLIGPLPFIRAKNQQLENEAGPPPFGEGGA